MSTNENGRKLIRKKYSKKWIYGTGFLILIVIIFTFLKSPEDITTMLVEVTSQLRLLFLITHILMIFTLIIGFLLPKLRDNIFSLFMIGISLSATLISSIFVIIPNIILFGLISIELIYELKENKLKFDLRNLSVLAISFGVLGLLFGFWYLHWVEDPVWLNALLYSPLGGVNCPTLVTLAGFICIKSRNRNMLLDVTVAIFTLYFGFFGILRLGAYMDIVLVLCGGYLLTINLYPYVKKKKKKPRANNKSKFPIWT